MGFDRRFTQARQTWSLSLLLLFISSISTASPEAGAADGQAVELLHHRLAVELIPAEHRLIASDRLALKVVGSLSEPVVFSLHPSLRVTHLSERRDEDVRPVPFTVQPSQGGSGPAQEPMQQIAVRLGGVTPGQVVVLEWDYEGLVNDPPREPRHLRFVTPSETAGHIGNEGVYLSGETHWYPAPPRSLATYELKVTVPDGWEAVTHGRQTRRQTSGGVQRTVTAEWAVTAPTEALTLVANRFVKAEREWRDRAGNRIEIATYLFPEDAHLAQEYLEASAQYLDAYAELLGPYPFPKFAVVENFFASGLGIPSFTLLGSGVVKRHYVQPFALGHEIVHSWIGNWVLNDVEEGNWVEGLTTYLANYYYDELTGKQEQAREQRRMMLLGYAVYVRPDEDYPVARFRHKTDQRDNAIGYQKAAMVFHLLRREVGEQAFWTGLRRLVTERGGAYATWRDLERIFSAAGGKDLRWFFRQWVEEAGAPSLALVEAGVQPAGSASGPFVVTARVVQQGRPYRLRLPVSVTMADGRSQTVDLEMDGPERMLSVTLPARPVGLRLDPDFDLFRRLPRERIPPMLNLFVTDRQRALIVPEGGSEMERAPYRELGEQVASREKDVQFVTGEAPGPEAGSVLVLGGPGLNRAAAWAVRGCGDLVRLAPDRFTVEGKTYEGAGMALLVTCRRPDRPEGVVSLFYGLTPQAVAKVARLLFFYGWQSYLVFRDGTIVARGDLPPAANELEVRFEAVKGDR